MFVNKKDKIKGGQVKRDLIKRWMNEWSFRAVVPTANSYWFGKNINKKPKILRPRVQAQDRSAQVQVQFYFLFMSKFRLLNWFNSFWNGVKGTLAADDAAAGLVAVAVLML